MCVSQTCSKWIAKLQSLFTKKEEHSPDKVKARVIEVIVSQALAGAPWREICGSQMAQNNIAPEEIEAEINKRQSAA